MTPPVHQRIAPIGLVHTPQDMAELDKMADNYHGTLERTTP